MSTSETSSLSSKLEMLATMLDKLEKLYPEFADKVYWERAIELLAEFCVPEELRRTVDYSKSMPDEYYMTLIADHLQIEYVDVYEAFYLHANLHSSKSKEPLSL